MNTPLRFGKYDIVKVLGKGGMGTVYLGYDKKLNRHVAIKTILREELEDDAISSEYARRFELEAKAVAKLNHPNIVSVYDSGEEGDTAYLVMEFIEGNDLKYYFDKEIDFELEEIIRLMTDLLEALAHAHEKGVWHRDIKPANVMIDISGQVKLTDFGVSRIADHGERSRVGTMVGTLYYMSPEQVLNTNVSHRSDIFAAGVILYQFLTKTRPFLGSDYEITNKIVQQEAIPPSHINHNLPPKLDAILAKSMAKNPDLRYATARDFILDLKKVLGERREPVLDPEATRYFYASQGSKNSIDQLPASNVRTGGQSGQQSSQRAARTGNMEGDGALTSPSETAEIEFWRSIKDGSDVEEFALYLSRFPGGTYAALARKRIEKLDSSLSLPVTPPTTTPHPIYNTGSHTAPQARTTPPGASSRAPGAMKIEPSMDGNGNHTPREPAIPISTAVRPANNWMMPAAILLGAGLISAVFWFGRTPAPVPNPVTGTINTAPVSATSAATSAATSSGAAAITNTATSASSSATSLNDDVAKAQAAAAAAIEKAIAEKAAAEKAAAELAAQRLQTAKLTAQQTKDAAAAEKLKREEAATKTAKEAIARTSPGRCLTHTPISASDAGKSEAELCSATKAKAQSWIAQWATPAGAAKGWDKFQNPTLGECDCKENSCTISVAHFTLQSGACG
jgi:eukaryotic-like serine/threonine-protein kinase